jgi:DNA repair exonuclease SbcCD ATPase subunit
MTIDTGKIKDIEKSIEKIQRDRKTAESKICDYQVRINRLQTQQSEFENRKNALREARQTALVNSENTENLTKELKGIDSEVEIIVDELQGLQKAISTIGVKAAESIEQVEALTREKNNLEVVVLARRLNQELPKISELIREYNSTLQLTRNSAAGGLVYTGGYANDCPFVTVRQLEKLYIKGEWECPEGLKGHPDSPANYFFKNN